MNNATNLVLTHSTYAAAMADLKKRARKGDSTVARWDAGGGFTAEAYFCAWRKRIVHTTINNSTGFRIV